MLKFNSWPPRVGEVEFTNQALAILDAASSNIEHGDYREPGAFNTGYYCGSILLANADIATVHDIAEDLTATLKQGVKASFNYGLQYGIAGHGLGESEAPIHAIASQALEPIAEASLRSVLGAKL